MSALGRCRGLLDPFRAAGDLLGWKVLTTDDPYGDTLDTLYFLTDSETALLVVTGDDLTDGRWELGYAECSGL